MSSSKSHAMLVATALSLFHAPTVRAQPSVAPSEPATPSAPHARRDLVWAGATVFALSYLSSALSATTGYGADDGNDSSRAPLWVPIAGPFVMLGSTRSAGADALLVLDGLAQIGGLTLFVYGLASPKTIRVEGETRGHLELSIAPLITRGAFFATLVATF